MKHLEGNLRPLAVGRIICEAKKKDEVDETYLIICDGESNKIQ
jgi:hypothetical protein